MIKGFSDSKCGYEVIKKGDIYSSNKGDFFEFIVGLDSSNLVKSGNFYVCDVTFNYPNSFSYQNSLVINAVETSSASSYDEKYSLPRFVTGSNEVARWVDVDLKEDKIYVSYHSKDNTETAIRIILLKYQ